MYHLPASAPEQDLLLHPDPPDLVDPPGPAHLEDLVDPPGPAHLEDLVDPADLLAPQDLALDRCFPAPARPVPTHQSFRLPLTPMREIPIETYWAPVSDQMPYRQ